MKSLRQRTAIFVTITAFVCTALLAVGGGIFNDANNWQNLQTFNNAINTSRLTTGRGTATPLVTGDFVLSSGWGAGSNTTTAMAGTDQNWTATITGVGGSQGASPTITLTFHDGTWTNAPNCIATFNGGTGTYQALLVTTTATTEVITYNGTPGNSTYIVTSLCLGR